MGSAAITVRSAFECDCEGILACLASAFEPYRADYTPAGFEDSTLTPESIRQRLREMTVFVAVNEAGGIVGTITCCVLDKQEGHLRGMAVLPEWHGRSIARQLLDRAQDELSSRGCDRITLDTTEPLQPAMRFYERNGFRRTGKIADFFGMPLIEYEKILVNRDQ